MKAIHAKLCNLPAVLMLVLVATAPSVRSAPPTSEVRAKVRALIQESEFREALDLLVDHCNDLTSASAEVSVEDLEQRTKEISSLLAFNAGKLSQAGTRYENALKELRVKYIKEAERQHFAPHTRPLVHAAMALSRLTGDEESTFKLYEALPEASRGYLKVDDFVFDRLWSSGRFAAIASSELAASTIEDRLSSEKGNNETVRAHLLRSRARHLALVAKTIAARREMGSKDQADALEKSANRAFTTKELEDGIAAATDFIKSQRSKESADKAK